jgi:hypothetical protein
MGSFNIVVLASLYQFQLLLSDRPFFQPLGRRGMGRFDRRGEGGQIREQALAGVPGWKGVGLEGGSVSRHFGQVLVDLCEGGFEVVGDLVQVLQILLRVIVLDHLQTLSRHKLQVLPAYRFRVLLSPCQQSFNLLLLESLALLGYHVGLALVVVLVAGLPEFEVEQDFLQVADVGVFGQLVLLEVDVLEGVFWRVQDLAPVAGLLQLLIQGVFPQLSLKIVPKLLLLLRQPSREHSIRRIPPLLGPLRHPLLPANMVIRVNKLPGMEFVDLVGLPVQLLDRVLHVDHGLVHLLGQWLRGWWPFLLGS